MQEYLAAIAIIENLKSQIISPLISLLFAIAFLYFLYGKYEFISEGADSKKLEKAKKHILWGIIGLFIMVAANGLLGFVSDTVQSLSK